MLIRQLLGTGTLKELVALLHYMCLILLFFIGFFLGERKFMHVVMNLARAEHQLGPSNANFGRNKSISVT